jgi:hypothetical protein
MFILLIDCVLEEYMDINDILSALRVFCKTRYKNEPVAGYFVLPK